jgi:hypothetical protein
MWRRCCWAVCSALGSPNAPCSSSVKRSHDWRQGRSGSSTIRLSNHARAGPSRYDPANVMHVRSYSNALGLAWKAMMHFITKGRSFVASCPEKTSGASARTAIEGGRGGGGAEDLMFWVASSRKGRRSWGSHAGGSSTLGGVGRGHGEENPLGVRRDLALIGGGGAPPQDGGALLPLLPTTGTPESSAAQRGSVPCTGRLFEPSHPEFKAPVCYAVTERGSEGDARGVCEG